MEKLQDKAKSMGLISHKDYYKKRLQFITWARSERYTLSDIGNVLGISKQGVRKVLLTNSK